MYMTLHGHQIDGRSIVENGDQYVPVPQGWHIASGNSDDMRVCAAHAWQSHWLVFANGDMYGTAVCNLPSFIGESVCSGCVGNFDKGIEMIPQTFFLTIDNRKAQR